MRQSSLATNQDERPTNATSMTDTDRPFEPVKRLHTSQLAWGRQTTSRFQSATSENACLNRFTIRHTSPSDGLTILCRTFRSTRVIFPSKYATSKPWRILDARMTRRTTVSTNRNSLESTN